MGKRGGEGSRFSEAGTKRNCAQSAALAAEMQHLNVCSLMSRRNRVTQDVNVSPTPRCSHVLENDRSCASRAGMSLLLYSL